MTPYAVDWNQGALSDLADIWAQASDRRAVTDASDAADKLLANDPIKHGRHESEGLYRLVVPPLVIFYGVDMARRRVEVSRVWYRP